MRHNNRTHLVSVIAVRVVIMLIYCGVPILASADEGFTAWLSYSTDEKQVALAGFAHCFRTLTPEKTAFSNANTNLAVKFIQARELPRTDSEFAKVVWQGLEQAAKRPIKPSGEQWAGPYGFATGLWWRDIDFKTREAYLRGVFWCATLLEHTAKATHASSMSDVVMRLNEWYDISDDNWKGRQSNDRVDVPVIIAMERLAILSGKEVYLPLPR